MSFGSHEQHDTGRIVQRTVIGHCDTDCPDQTILMLTAQVTSSSMRMRSRCCVNSTPILARTDCGSYGSVVLPRKSTPLPPTASDVRRMVPTFPGSCTVSRATKHRQPLSSTGDFAHCCRRTATSPCEPSLQESFLNTSAVTSMVESCVRLCAITSYAR